MRAILVSAFALTALIPPAAAADNLQALCANDSGQTSASERITACSQLLSEGKGGPAVRIDIHINRAWSYGQLGGWEKAFADYEAALKINAGAAKVHNEKGLARLRMGRYEDAVTNYDRALKLDPRMTYSYYGRALAKSKLGQTAAAEADFAAAQRIDPGVEAVFERIGLRR